MMTQEDYNNLVSSLVNQLLEEGPEVAADNKEGATTPDVPEEEGSVINKFQTAEPQQQAKSSLVQTAKKHPVLAAGAIAGADEALGLLKRLFGSHHFGSHAALKGQTSGTGAD